VRPIGWLAAAYLQVEDRPRIIMVLESLKTAGVVVGMHVFAIVTPRLFGDGVPGRSGPGEIGACVAVGVAFALSALAYMAVIKQTSGVSLGEQLAALGPPLLACFPMTAVVLLLEHTLAGTTSPWIRLAMEIAAGGLVFVPSAWMLAPVASRELLALLREALRARRPLPQPP
jgi:hypothetical protein